MLLYRVDDLTSGDWPKDLQKRAQRLFDELREGIVAFTKKQFGKVTTEYIDRTIFAIHDASIGILRRYLQENKISAAILRYRKKKGVDYDQRLQ